MNSGIDLVPRNWLGPVRPMTGGLRGSCGVHLASLSPLVLLPRIQREREFLQELVRFLKAPRAAV
jgi:hypothetical protein